MQTEAERSAAAEVAASLTMEPEEFQAWKARREKRERIQADWIARGMTPREAQIAYGIGRWSNEVDWPKVKAAIQLNRLYAHQALSECAQAGSGRDANEWAHGFFPSASSFPRTTAWADYAIRVFFGGVKLPARGHLTRGRGWRFVGAK